MRQIHLANTGVINQHQQLIYFAIFDPSKKKILFDLVTRWQRSDIGRFGFSQVFASLHRQCRVPLRASASGRGHSSSLMLNLMYYASQF